jgi:hypothetical protein
METGKDAHCGEAGLNGIYEKSGGFSKRIFFVGEGFRNKFIMKKGKNWYIL